VQGGAARVLATDMGFTEGPVFRRCGDIVVTSLDRGILYAVTEGGARVFAVTGGGANGAAEGADESIYVAQSPARGQSVKTGGIQVARSDGSVDWITMDLVSPNDLCFGPDGWLWVTDPTRRPARDDSRLWRVNVETGEAELLMSVGYYANGIGFGVDHDAVYVVSTGERRIVRYSIVGNGLGKAETVIQMEHGHPDGFAFDAAGFLVIGVNADEQSAEGSVQVWDLKGRLHEVLRPLGGQRYTNVAISTDRRLIVTHPDRGAVFEMSWPNAGLLLFPFR
jgi:gluconolactonase